VWLVYEHVHFLLRIGIELLSTSRTNSTDTYFPEMSTNLFKSYVTLVIEQQILYKRIIEAEAAGQFFSNLQAHYDDVGARARRVLVGCYTTAYDKQAVHWELQGEYESELIRNGASEQERRLAKCYNDVACTCVDLNFLALSNDESDDISEDDDVARTCVNLNFLALSNDGFDDISEDEWQLLRKENEETFRKVCEYIRRDYLGFR